MIFHNFQLRSCFLAIFLATGGTGRAVAGKCPKKGLKCYLGGPVAVKNALQNVLGTEAAKTAHFD
jgi:hypothetical protein